ncbi:MAG: hypothetical protein KIT27_02755 [Legionellales bacterium]|nr:hypothetical protein [Legionellales bacterium]
MERYLLYLTDLTASAVDVLHVAANGEPMQYYPQMASDKLAQLHLPITIILHSRFFRLQTVALPKVKPHLRLQALPFAIEEKVLSPIADLFFPVFTPLNHDPLVCAIINRTHMDELVRWITQQAIRVQAVLPDLLLIPYDRLQPSVLCYQHYYLVRNAEWQGFLADQENWQTQLALSTKVFSNSATTISAETVAKEKVAKIHVYDFSQQFSFNDPDIDWHETPASPLYLFAKHVEQYSSANFLQGDYQLKREKNQRERKIKILAILAIILIVVFSISKTLQWWYLTRQLSIVQNHIATLYYQLFPQATSVISPRLRIERELNGLNQHNPNQLFFNLLSGVASTHQSVTMLSLQFQDNKLVLHVKTQLLREMTQFLSDLSHSGLHFSHSLQTKPNEVLATITLGGV